MNPATSATPVTQPLPTATDSTNPLPTAHRVEGDAKNRHVPHHREAFRRHWEGGHASVHVSDQRTQLTRHQRGRMFHRHPPSPLFLLRVGQVSPHERALYWFYSVARRGPSSLCLPSCAIVVHFIFEVAVCLRRCRVPLPTLSAASALRAALESHSRARNVVL